ncbi:unnamed protein product, partial [Sphacelaria rigidula]
AEDGAWGNDSDGDNSDRGVVDDHRRRTVSAEGSQQPQPQRRRRRRRSSAEERRFDEAIVRQGSELVYFSVTGLERQGRSVAGQDGSGAGQDDNVPASNEAESMDRARLQ